MTALPTVRFSHYGDIDAGNAAHVVGRPGEMCEVRVLLPSGGFVLAGWWDEAVAVQTATDLNRALGEWARLAADACDACSGRGWVLQWGGSVVEACDTCGALGTDGDAIALARASGLVVDEEGNVEACDDRVMEKRCVKCGAVIVDPQLPAEVDERCPLHADDQAEE